MQQTMNGIVKWFNDAKGYGFIAYEGNEAPGAFAHYTAINSNCDHAAGCGFKTLAEGQKVNFVLIDGPKGPQAMSIDRIITV